LSGIARHQTSKSYLMRKGC